ncbi:membrane protein insertase YidC [Nocardioides ferulae]|uniref:membrane protein insertase YidC n=1 Tax=Nocardioides ferulae TaxID=2340821 RepID=UPI000EAED752|nr:membrane protein insertase YidC [Nocardioides ferulae]
MGIFGDIGNLIMTPLYYAISAVLVGWHKLFSLFLDKDGGLAWALSIVGLTLVIRAALIPLFVKQIKSSRNMQLIQPKVKELQKKYGHDRERLAQETMKLYKETGTNPFASCLPILLQMPIFLALFRLLDQAADGKGHGVLTTSLAKSFGSSELGGAIPLAATFLKADGSGTVMSFAALLVVAMTITTFTTQRQLMAKNMPADALSGPYAQQQKLLLYVLPVVFAVGGIAFPIGVLLYWTTSNLWTMGQQFYVIRNNPAPGTPAAKAKEERDRHRAERKGIAVVTDQPAPASEPEGPARPAPRQQPKKQTRSQRKQGGGRPTAAAPRTPKPPSSKPGNKGKKK